MHSSITDPNMAYYFALIFGIIIALYAAALGIMGSIDYFFLTRSRFSVLRITAITGILLSLVLTLTGLFSLSQKEFSNLWYSIGLPGLLGLIICSSLYYIILKKKALLRQRFGL